MKREQTNRAPTMSSFGHRPTSASRTFHPATMKVLLKKGEIAKPNANGSNGFGLTPSILSKILQTPKLQTEQEAIEFEHEELREQVRREQEIKRQQRAREDPHHLFSSSGGATYDETADGGDMMSSISHLGNGRDDNQTDFSSRMGKQKSIKMKAEQLFLLRISLLF